MKRNGAWFALAVACLGCSGATPDDEIANQETSLDTAQLPILNGTDWSGWPDGRSVHLSVGCTGTLIRDNWVLTARHCVTTGGTRDPLADPTTVEIDRVGDVVPSPKPRGVKVYAHPALRDVALIRFDINAGLDGLTDDNRAFTEIYGGKRQDFPSLFCSGYGQENYATESDCENKRGTGGDAQEEFAFMSATPATNAWEDDGTSDNKDTELSMTPNGSDQVLTSGDSGAGCAVHTGGDSDPSEWKQVYVHSRSLFSGCSKASTSNWVRNEDRGADMVAFRSWVNDIIGRYERSIIFSDDGLCGDSFLAYWSPPGQTPSWQCTPAGWRHDNSNSGKTIIAGQLHWGPMVVKTEEPISNGLVRVDIWSTDNDTAGVVGRARDKDNFYAFVINPQNARAQIIKAHNGTLSVVKHKTWSGFGSNWGGDWQTVELRMTGPHLIGMVNGEIVVEAHDVDDPHTTGYVGFMHAYMNPVNFDDFYARSTWNGITIVEAESR